MAASGQVDQIEDPLQILTSSPGEPRSSRSLKRRVTGSSSPAKSTGSRTPPEEWVAHLLGDRSLDMGSCHFAEQRVVDGVSRPCPCSADSAELIPILGKVGPYKTCGYSFCMKHVGWIIQAIEEDRASDPPTIRFYVPSLHSYVLMRKKAHMAIIAVEAASAVRTEADQANVCVCVPECVCVCVCL